MDDNEKTKRKSISATPQTSFDMSTFKDLSDQFPEETASSSSFVYKVDSYSAMPGPSSSVRRESNISSLDRAVSTEELPLDPSTGSLSQDSKLKPKFVFNNFQHWDFLWSSKHKHGHKNYGKKITFVEEDSDDSDEDFRGYKITLLDLFIKLDLTNNFSSVFGELDDEEAKKVQTPIVEAIKKIADKKSPTPVEEKIVETPVSEEIKKVEHIGPTPDIESAVSSPENIHSIKSDRTVSSDESDGSKELETFLKISIESKFLLKFLIIYICILGTICAIAFPIIIFYRRDFKANHIELTSFVKSPYTTRKPSPMSLLHMSERNDGSMFTANDQLTFTLTEVSETYSTQISTSTDDVVHTEAPIEKVVSTTESILPRNSFKNVNVGN